MAAKLMRTLDWGRPEAGLIRLLDPPFGTDLEESFSQEGRIPVWYLGKCPEIDSRPFVWLAHALDRVGHYGGAALSLYLQGLVRHATSSDKHQGTH